MSRIPDTLSDISAPWVSRALDTAVTAVSVIDEHHGTTGRAILQLQYANPENQPERLFVKLPPTDLMQREFVRSSGMGKREAMFYQQLSAEIPVRVPRSYYAAASDSGEHYIMLLENLVDSGCTFNNASTRYDMDYIRQVLASFARLHAAYWESPRFKTDLNWLQPPLQHDIALPLMERALEQYGGTMPGIFRDMGELFLNNPDAMHRLWRRGEATVIHGDVHDANLFYDSDEPGFLDWALVAKGPCMRDVGYFLAGTLEPNDQRAVGKQMLEYYREQLLSADIPAPSNEVLWQQYQWHAAYVWLGASITLAMGDAWQPINYVMASMERLHAALKALGSYNAIRSALD